MEQLIDGIDLEKDTYNQIIKLRFLEEIKNYEKKRDKTKIYYNFFRFSVTTGSILLPAILSIGQMDPTKLPKNFDQISYWMTWIISLLVTMSNGFLQLFSLDKNYFNYSVVVEQLKTEGWQFFSLSGKYSEFDTHQEAYKTFLKYVESIKRKQVEQEFSSSKGDKKKKPEFNFQKEFQKVQNEALQNGKAIQDSVTNTALSGMVNPAELKTSLLNNFVQPQLQQASSLVQQNQLNQVYSQNQEQPVNSQNQVYQQYQQNQVYQGNDETSGLLNPNSININVNEENSEKSEIPPVPPPIPPPIRKD